MLKAHGDFIVPKNVPANEFLNLEGSKISTSKNWAVWLPEYLKDFPDKQDVLRYVLTINAPENKDNDFTWKDFQNRNNGELVSILGNFINRVVVLTKKYYQSVIPTKNKLFDSDKLALKLVNQSIINVESHLNNFKFSYTFQSSTELYKKGFFNETLILILNNFNEIMNIIIPTLGKERQKTYSPFLPICPNTEKVLEIPVKEIKNKENKIIFDNNGKDLEASILDGNCKLQWKVDWAMRWYALDVDFEMYGKDLIESAILSTKIIKVLGKNNPSGFAYELFLDEKGEKISKSKGNGITIDQWLKYASPESLSLFMYQNPKRAKKLYDEVVSKAVDEYLNFIDKSKTQDELQLLLNPAWHVHNGKVPKEDIIMSFSMLLNLVETSNATSKEILWKFVKKYKTNINEKNFPIFDQLIGYAIKYFDEVIKKTKKYIKPNSEERKALNQLVKKLESCNNKMTPEEIQTEIYTVGKENGYKDKLRDWFKLIYQVTFGDENGPRMGFFISFFGLSETIELIKNKLNNV